MKLIKRVLSITLILGICISLFSGIQVSANKPFEYDFSVDGWQTREADKAYITEIAYDDGDDGKVLEVKPSYTTRYISSHTFPDTTKDISLHLSFDFKYVGDTANYGYMYVKDGALFPHDMETASNYPSFTVRPDGNFSYFEKDWEHSKNVISGAKSDVWYRVDSIYDLKNQKVKHYVNGEYIGEGMSKHNYLSALEICASTLKGYDNSLDAISGGTYYFDNILVKEIGENITATFDKNNTTGSAIAVKFSEPVNAEDFNKLTLTDCESFEVKKISTVEQINATTIGVVASGLKYGAEYKLSVPAGISGEYGNTTKAADVYVNAADDIKFVPGGTPAGEDKVIFEENFSDYAVMINPGDSKTFTAKWSATGPVNYLCGPFINDIGGNNALRSYHAWNNDAMGVNLRPAIDATANGNKKTGAVEIEFDVSFLDEAACGYNHFFAFLVNDGSADYPFFNILKTGEVDGYSKVEYTTHNPIPGYTVSTDDISKFNTFKVNIDFDNAKATLYMKKNGAFEKIHEAPLGNALASKGFKTFTFQHYRTAQAAVEHKSGSAIDNITIREKGAPAKAEFEENFVDYTDFYNNSASGTSSDKECFGSVTPVRWTRGGTKGWGFNSYVCNFNGNKLLKQDGWQWGTSAETNVTSAPLSSPAKNGVVEIAFDAAVQNPEANINKNYDNYFIVGIRDGSGAYMPALKIDTTDIIAYPTLTDGTEKTLSYKNGNSYSSFGSYKILLDYKTGKAEFYVKDGEEYKLAESGEMNKNLIANGFSSLVFSFKKFDSGNGPLAVDTGSLVDNIKINTEKQVQTPVVKSVRIDGVAAYDAVPVNSKQIKVYFNKLMDKSTLTGILVSGASYANGVYDEKENSYTITLDEELEPLKEHTISVPITVKDADGNALGRAYEGKFTTAKGIFTISEFSLVEGSSPADLGTTAAGDKLTAKVGIKNGAELMGEYVLVYMIYDGDRLVAIDYVAVPFDESTETVNKSIDITIPATEGQLGVKVMLWDSFANMNQMMDAIELK